jgi:hypothetical protein
MQEIQGENSAIPAKSKTLTNYPLPWEGRGVLPLTTSYTQKLGTISDLTETHRQRKDSLQDHAHHRHHGERILRPSRLSSFPPANPGGGRDPLPDHSANWKHTCRISSALPMAQVVLPVT